MQAREDNHPQAREKPQEETSPDDTLSLDFSSKNYKKNLTIIAS